MNMIFNATETEAENKLNEKIAEMAAKARREALVLKFACALIQRDDYENCNYMIFEEAGELADYFITYVDNTDDGSR